MGQNEEPAPVPESAVGKGAQAVQPEVGTQGQGVDLAGRAGFEVRVCISVGGGADVAALGIEDDRQVALSGAGRDPLESGEPPGAERFEEGDLGLHRGDATFEPIQDGEQEFLDGCRCFRIPGRHAAAPEQGRQQIAMRIESRAERVAEFAHASHQCVGEVQSALPGRVRPDNRRSPRLSPPARPSALARAERRPGGRARCARALVP